MLIYINECLKKIIGKSGCQKRSLADFLKVFLSFLTTKDVLNVINDVIPFLHTALDATGGNTFIVN